MNVDSASSFWAGGLAAYLEALEEEEAEVTASLYRELKGETDPDRRMELCKRIASLRDEFREKRRNAKYCLFLDSDKAAMGQGG